jgi:lysophospholipase L1-like esterase
MRRRAFFLALMLLSASSIEARPHTARLAAGDHYVAMGSSFAAGPGITTPADLPANRCTRSRDNYAHQLAARLGLSLTDVSCGGATTTHILGRWNELPPQIDAVRADTKLVTITIGGNDVNYIGALFASSCAARPDSALCRGFAARQSGAPPPEPDEATWQVLEGQLDRIAGEVRLRAPNARLVFVDYLTILPAKTLCAAAPLSPAHAAAARAKAARLISVTARAARRAGAVLVQASQLSAKHDVCAPSPWMNGFPLQGGPPFMVGYHPNLAGMTAVTSAIEQAVRRGR